MLKSLAAALALLAPMAHAQEVEWRLGSPVGPQDPLTADLEAVAERVADRSDGRFAIEIVPIETVGFKNVDSLRILDQGVLDAMMIAPYYAGRDEPLLNIFAPHGVLIDVAQNFAIVDVQFEIMEEILSENWDVAIAGRSPFGSLRDLIIVSKEPIESLEDLRGMKLRHFTADGMAAFQELGVSTQVVPSSELYLALQTGVVDAAVYGPTYVRFQSINEVTSHMTYLSTLTMAYPFVVGTGAETYEALPDDLKTILREELRASWQNSVDGWETGAEEASSYEWLAAEGGMGELGTLPEADRDAVQAELVEVWRAQVEEIGPEALAYFDRIQEALTAE